MRDMSAADVVVDNVEAKVGPGKAMEEREGSKGDDSAINLASPNNSETSTVDVEMNSPPSGLNAADDKAEPPFGHDGAATPAKDADESSTEEDVPMAGDDDDFPPSPTPPPLTIEPSQPPSSMVSAATIAAAAAAAALSTSAASSASAVGGAGAQVLTMAAARQIMFDNYTPWVMRTYGDSAKTKTITTRKYARIVALLRSQEKDAHEASAANSSGGSTSEAAKFRLWVKSKGFHLGPPMGHPDRDKPGSADMLYLPTGTDKTVDGKVHFVYKRVAMVEQFFDIIYSVHVEAAGDTQLRGRAGKHCGQKRTYRAVADQFAFIPREAISKFLLHCIECQRKNSMEHRNGGSATAGAGRGGKHQAPSSSSAAADQTEMMADSSTRDSGDTAVTPVGGGAADYRPLSPAPSLVDQLRNSPFAALNGGAASSAAAVGSSAVSVGGNLSPPTTPSCATSSATTMTPSAAAAFSQAMAAMQSHQFRSLQMRTSLLQATASQNPLFASQAAALLGGGDASVNSAAAANSIFGSFAATAQLQQQQQQAAAAAAAAASMSANIDLSLPITNTYLRRMRALGLATAFDPTNYSREVVMAAADKDASGEADSKKDTNGGSTNEWTENQQHPTSHLSALLAQNGKNGDTNGSDLVGGGGAIGGLAVGASGGDNDDSSSAGAKDDEDEDDDDEDKAEGGDPEKLKAFNMFVRLFVDENLDRMVPISKQPKEKIQAIIDSCTRQFPEHAAKARKRIRTYLKSCRRNKRTRDQAGLDGGNSRTTPHLTSVQAEHLLARACENEAENAKRMRMGLEPISQPLPAPFTTTAPVDVLAAAAAAAQQDAAAASSTATAIPIPVSSTPSLTVFPSVSLTGEKQLKTEYKSEQLASLLAAAQQQQQQQQPAKIVSATPVSSTASLSAFPTLNGNGVLAAGTTAPGLYRSSFQVNPSAFPGTAALLQQQQGPAANPLSTTTAVQNGPNNLADGLKKQPLLSHKLNTTEMGAVRQLITGYRESAAFLLRSADELEHLLQIQPKL